MGEKTPRSDRAESFIDASGSHLETNRGWRQSVEIDTACAYTHSVSLSLLALSLQVGLLLSLSSVTATSDKSPVAHTEPTAGGLSVSPQLERVSVLPGCVGRPALDVVGSVTLLSKTSALSARRRQTSHLSVLVHGVADPVDLGVVSDRVVRRVHENHIVVLVGTVLVHPVRVQHSQVRASLADSVFGHGLQVSGELKLVDTVVLGLSEHNASRVRSLSASSSHSASVHNVTLLANTAKNTVNKDWQKSKKLSSLPHFLLSNQLHFVLLWFLVEDPI